MESSIKPGIFDETIIDRMLYVKTPEAFSMTRRLASEEGLLLGISSGAAVHAAVELAKKIPVGLLWLFLPTAVKNISPPPFGMVKKKKLKI